MAEFLAFLRVGSFLASAWSTLTGWWLERRGEERQKSADDRAGLKVLEAERQATGKSPRTKDELLQSLHKGEY